jgi:hypothetical protein
MIGAGDHGKLSASWHKFAPFHRRQDVLEFDRIVLKRRFRLADEINESMAPATGHDERTEIDALRHGPGFVFFVFPAAPALGDNQSVWLLTGAPRSSLSA